MKVQEINEAIKGLEHSGQVSDGYHTFEELYEYRMLYNAGLFNEWADQGKYDVHKSYKHHDGEECFGGGWFIVVAITPYGQITNHYRNEHWDLFQVQSAKEALYAYDGHTPQEAKRRLLQTIQIL